MVAEAKRKADAAAKQVTAEADEAKSPGGPTGGGCEAFLFPKPNIYLKRRKLDLAAAIGYRQNV